MKNTFYILVCSEEFKPNDRSGEDYVKVWVNDTLLFSDVYYTNYIDSTMTNLDDALGMDVGTINKYNRDSLKIRVRIVSLDSILFAGKHAVDTTFYYGIKDIPCVAVYYSRYLNSFGVFDPVRNPVAWQFD